MLPKKLKKTPIQFRLDQALVDELDRIRKATGLTRNAVLEAILREHLENQK